MRGCALINKFNSAILLCLSQAMAGFTTIMLFGLLILVDLLIITF